MPASREAGRTAVSRALAVLYAFRPGDATLALSELTARTGLPHATVRRIALELVAHAALERTEEGRFAVGLRVWETGARATRSSDPRAVARPYLQDLAHALRQHVQLAVLDGDEAVITERISARRAFDVVSEVGGRLPLHCSGVGKAMLAHGGADQLARVVSAGLRSYTSRTSVDAAMLRRDLARIRRLGYAEVRDELSWGAHSVAVPIRLPDGRFGAALGVVVPTGSMRIESVVPALIAAGRGVSRELALRRETGGGAAQRRPLL